MNYLEIDIIDGIKIISEYHQIIKAYKYSKINPKIRVLEWMFFNRGLADIFKKYTYLDTLLSEIGYDKIDNIAFIKLKNNSEFIFNREGTYKKNYRVYEIPILGGRRIDYCNDNDSKYRLEFNKLYLINADKKLKITNHANIDYINITITVKNTVQHLNVANSTIPQTIKKFYSCLHSNKDTSIHPSDYDDCLFTYKKLNETIIKKSSNFITVCATNNISNLLNNLRSCNNVCDVYIWIYDQLNINMEILEDTFYNAKFNIYYNISTIDSCKWGSLINIYLFKKYYTKVLIIKDTLQISHSSIEKIFDQSITRNDKIVCAYGFNFKDCGRFNNKTAIYNDIVDYASLDFSVIPIDLISDGFFEWSGSVKNYISRMEYILNVYSVTNKKYTMISYNLDILFIPPKYQSKSELNYINSCYKYFIKKYNYPFKRDITHYLEDVPDMNDSNNIIVMVVLRHHVTVKNLKKCLDSIKQQKYPNIKVCIINDRFWGDYDIINLLVDYVRFPNWYYIDNTFNIGTFLCIQVGLELLNANDSDIIINVEPYLELLSSDIIKKIVHSFSINNIYVLFGNISCVNMSVFTYESINWANEPDNTFNSFLKKEYCETIINPLIDETLVYTNPFKYMCSFSCKYFRYVGSSNFNNNFVIEMLNKSEGYIEIFCKPLSKSLVLDNQKSDIINYKKGVLNYTKFILKDIEPRDDLVFKFARRTYVYESLCKNSQTLYVIFASQSKWDTIKHLLPILKRIDCNVVLLRDKNNYFLNGVPNLSNSIDFTIEYIRALIRKTKSSIVKTYGIGDSAFAAIYYGTACNVTSIIVKSPHIRIENRSKRWVNKIIHDNSTSVFFNLENISSSVPIKWITDELIGDIPKSLNIELFKESHIDLGYFVNDIFPPG